MSRIVIWFNNLSGKLKKIHLNLQIITWNERKGKGLSAWLVPGSCVSLGRGSLSGVEGEVSNGGEGGHVKWGPGRADPWSRYWVPANPSRFLWAINSEEPTISSHFFQMSVLPLTLCDFRSILISLGLSFLENGDSPPVGCREHSMSQSLAKCPCRGPRPCKGLWCPALGQLLAKCAVSILFHWFPTRNLWGEVLGS